MASKAPKRRTVRKTAKITKPAPASRASHTRAKPSAKPQTKLDRVIAALMSPKGATLAQLMDLTGWQMHSVRGALSGTLKKQRGLIITSTKTDDERVYRIESKK